MNPNILIETLASLTVITSPVSWFYAVPILLEAVERKRHQRNTKQTGQLISPIEFLSIALCCESWMFYCAYLESPKQIIMNLIPALIFLGYSIWADIINDSKYNGIHFIAATFVWGIMSFYLLNQSMNGLMGGAFGVVAAVARTQETFGIIAKGDGRLISAGGLIIGVPNQICWLCDGILLMDPYMTISKIIDVLVSIFQISVYFLVRPKSTPTKKKQ